VRAYGTSILGASYNPVFDKVFHRLLVYSPAFKPKREVFTGRFNGKSTEFYPNIMDAVIALADNKKELKQLREGTLQAEEKKAKERRDVEETLQRIGQLKAADFGDPKSADQAVGSGEGAGAHAKEIEQLQATLEVQKQEYEKSLADYHAALDQWWVEVAKIKTQVTAFSPEQRALAANIQAAVETVRGMLTDSKALVTVAGVQFGRAVPRVKDELILLGQSGPIAIPRIKRIYTNLVTLPTNITVIKDELGVTSDESKGYDGLFQERLKVETSGKS
jgi:hypothetical protein